MKTLIAIVIIIGLTAVAGAIFIGVKSFDGIVTEHPYEKGLLWDETERKRSKLGWRVEILNREFITGDNNVVISVLDKNNMPLTLTNAALHVSRPATATSNKNFDIILIRDGMFSARLNFPQFGYWDIGINISSGGESLLFEKRVFVKKGGKTS
jgi:nitrogen fixation protein FixH